MKADLKIVKGSGEVVKVNKNLYVILKKLPKPMKEFGLTLDQMKWYNHFGKILVSSEKLTEPDIIHLVRLSKSVDYYLLAENKISENGYNGLVQTFKSGATNITAHLTVREKMIKEIDELSKHFGFSFKDRSKLNLDEKENPDQMDLFAEFLNKKHG